MRSRIAGYDFARCLALFGLVIADLIHNAGTHLYLLDILVQGGGIVAFFGLAGIGISLLKQRDQETSDAHRFANGRKRLIRRASSLLVVGILCNLIWHTNFLCRYSICIVIGALLLTAAKHWLWSLAFVFIVIFVVFMFLIFDYSEIFRSGEAWPDSDLWTVEGIITRLHVNGFHLIFSGAAFLVIGMWLGRQKVPSPQVRMAMFFGGIAVALVSCVPWLLMHYAPLLLQYVPLVPSRPVLSDISRSGINSGLMLLLLVDIFGKFGAATVIIGGSLMLTEKYADVKWTRPFIATGQLALTLYIAHLVIGMGLLEARGVLNKTLPFAIGSAVLFCICAVIFSHFWTKRFNRGPLEWGIRRITG